MKQFYLETEQRKIRFPTWENLEDIIVDLDVSGDDFVVLANIENQQDYIQTCVTNEKFREQGFYTIEIRKQIIDNFFQYRFMTDDVDIILCDFFQFFHELAIDIDKYTDITNEYKN